MIQLIPTLVESHIVSPLKPETLQKSCAFLTENVHSVVNDKLYSILIGKSISIYFAFFHASNECLGSDFYVTSNVLKASGNEEKDNNPCLWDVSVELKNKPIKQNIEQYGMLHYNVIKIVPRYTKDDMFRCAIRCLLEHSDFDIHN